jgi:HAD superfamily hydrolase (TIGR01662 family)
MTTKPTVFASSAVLNPSRHTTSFSQWVCPKIESMDQIRAVVLDIGETILDRSREYAAWAQFFGVPPHTFSAVFGGMITRGSKVAAVIESFAPGRDYSSLLAERDSAGITVQLEERDLYPDVRDALAGLRRLGLTIGVVGNQPAAVSAQLRSLDLDVDFIASSTDWGVSKPSPEFFTRILESAGAVAGETVYVGDQLDNDVSAPLAAGLQAVRLIRGPWGYLMRDAAVEARCRAVIHSLTELPAVCSGNS